MTTQSQKISELQKIQLRRCYLHLLNAEATDADRDFIDTMKGRYPVESEKLYKDLVSIFDNKLTRDVLRMEATNPKLNAAIDALLKSGPRTLSTFWSAIIVIVAILIGFLTYVYLYAHQTYGWTFRQIFG